MHPDSILMHRMLNKYKDEGLNFLYSLVLDNYNETWVEDYSLVMFLGMKDLNMSQDRHRKYFQSQISRFFDRYEFISKNEKLRNSICQ